MQNDYFEAIWLQLIWKDDTFRMKQIVKNTIGEE